MTVLKGLDIALYVNTEIDEFAPEPVWSMVGGQRGASLERETELVSINHKGGDGTTDYFATTSDWSVECDGILFLDDVAYEFLEEAYEAKIKIMVELRRGDKKYEGLALITSLPIEGAYDSEASYTVSLQGCGKLETSNLFVG